MNFPQAIASGFRNVFNYKARASRSEFWWFSLFSALALIVAAGIDNYVLAINDYRRSVRFDVNRFNVDNFDIDSFFAYSFPAPHEDFVFLFWLILFLPAFALGVRRLHDINHRGWWMLVPFLIPPILGTEGETGWWMLVPFLFFIFALIKGTEGENRFGPDPLGRHAPSDAAARELFSRDDPPQDAPPA